MARCSPQTIVLADPVPHGAGGSAFSLAYALAYRAGGLCGIEDPRTAAAARSAAARAAPAGWRA